MTFFILILKQGMLLCCLSLNNFILSLNNEMILTFFTVTRQKQIIIEQSKLVLVVFNFRTAKEKKRTAVL